MRALPACFGKSLVFSICLTLAAVLGTTFLTQSAAAQEQPQLVAATRRPLIIEALDESRLTVLKGNTHPLARHEFDIGAAPASLPMERMLLVLKRSDEQETALRKLLDDQQDKNSPHYHKWVTPEQFGAQFGPTDADMQMITSWLQSHGFQVGSTKGRTVLEFSGSASQVKEAFHSSIHKYVTDGEQHWANANDPSIPAALAPAVAGIKTLHNFLKKPMVHLTEIYVPAKLVAKARPEFTSSSGLHALTPSDYQTIYNVTPAFNKGVTGLGVTIAVVGRSNLFNQGQDISDFHNVFGGGNGLTIVLNGPDPGDVGGNDELEATLDASWAGALAPNANIDFVVSGSTNTTDGIDLSELYIIDNNLGAIMTESFGICEAAVTSADAQGISLLAEQAAAQGITYMVSAGDTGAAGCDNLGETTAIGGVSINALASNPFTVAMGGTLFNEHGQDATYWSTANNSTLGSAIAYIPENAWNETCTTACQQFQPPLAAGGGGASIYFQKPTWQSGVSGTNSDTVRDIPDISLTSAGHDFYLLCLEASCVPDSQGFISFAGVLGTSAAAPSFASIMALVDQNLGPQGVANYVLYPLALAQQTAGTSCNASSTSAAPNSACVFNDVTSGNISVPGETGYPNGVYAAAAGYDMATGLGSVNVANLVTQWPSVTFNATTTTLTLNGVSTPITITHGASVAVGGKVTSNSTTPTGDVALMAAIGPLGSLTNQTGVAEFTLGSGGVISGTTNELPGGTTYMVTARYAGNGTFAASTSAAIAVTVNKEASTTSVSGLDPNGLPLAGGTYPFGSIIFVRADVVGASGHGTPSGAVTFTDTFGALPSLNPQISPPVAVPNPSPLNSGGNTSIGDAIISFDAGNHSITASYGGDSSFNTSQSSAGAPVTFTIQPGFAGVSGPTDVSISSPGLSGTSTVGIIASSNFTTAISLTCGGLPAEATCSPASATGQGPTTVVNTNIIVSTMAPHTVMLRANEPRIYYAVLLGSGLPFGIFFVGASRRRRWSILALMMLLALIVAVPACGGGGSSHHQDPGTPAGTYTITVSATAGSLAQQGSFTLVVK
jgi:subtilase family serine protease